MRPFDPPPAPPPVGEVAPDEDASGRWDAPQGEYRVLNCATEPEGALGEKLATSCATWRPSAASNPSWMTNQTPSTGEDYLAVSFDADDVERGGEVSRPVENWSTLAG